MENCEYAPGMISVPIQPVRLDWPSAIGNFLLNCGMMEYLLNVFLKDHLSPDVFTRVKEWHFNDRVERIAQFLKVQEYPPGSKPHSLGCATGSNQFGDSGITSLMVTWYLLS